MDLQSSPYVVSNENFHKLSSDIADYPFGLIIPLNKPYRCSSAYCVGKVKYFFKRFFGDKKLKVGHAGTLDPLATGVLLVCVGKATKIAEQLQQGKKEYIAQVVFGATTPSYDRETPILETFEHKHITLSKIEEAASSMTGAQMQVPPLFSAKMVGGKRLYQLARKGESIEPKSSSIEIYSIETIADDAISAPPFITEEGDDNFVVKINFKSREPDDALTLISPEEVARLHKVNLKIECSKGTYIRSLARDLGLKLQSGAFLNALCRTRVGSFDIADTLSAELFS